MTQRFDELYIRRGEHQQIVMYYKKLVVHVCQKLRALQDERDRAGAIPKTCASETQKAFADTDTQLAESNVVQVDFRRPRRLS